MTEKDFVEEVSVETHQDDETVRIAPQDIPRDPDLLPESISIIRDEHIRLAFQATQFRPTPNSHRNIALDLSDAYTEAQYRKILDWFWAGVRPGCSLFIHPSFPIKPDVKPEHRLVMGYKKYTK